MSTNKVGMVCDLGDESLQIIGKKASNFSFFGLPSFIS
jgi:hypothetical protein